MYIWPMLARVSEDTDVINFLGLELTITNFLLIASSLALLIFFILLVILLLMYLRKRMLIRGYLPYEKKDYKLEDKILQVESEIGTIQKKFYVERQFKKSKKILKR